jgi:hypothetical protein
MKPKLKKITDWFQRQKSKYLHEQSGPAAPNGTTDLYFDWRRLRAKSRQNHANIHPGTQMYE